MNRTLPEMLHCLNTQGNGGADISMRVLERQQARMKWQQEQLKQQQQQEQSFYNGNELSMFSLPAQQAQQFQGLMDNVPNLDDFMNRVVKPDPGMENGWPGFGKFDGGVDDQLSYENTCGYGNVSGFDMNHTLQRMASCPPAVAAAMAEKAVSDVKGIFPANSSSVSGKENSKKRKANKNQNLKVVSEEDDMKEKRIKGCTEEEDSKITHKYGNSSNKNNKTANENSNNNSNSRENSADTSSKEKTKVSEVAKPDYIHVRARRGQATDSHSLAERVRREKISERTKFLQDLVPGCNKITGKAGVLDEIINYVQCLQRQVEFLSMKLAAVNPRLDVNIDTFFTKEMFQSSTTDFPAIGVSSEMDNPAYFQLNSLQQMISCCGLEMGINPTPVSSIPETFMDSSCFNQIQPPTTWDATELTNIYGMEFQ